MTIAWSDIPDFIIDQFVSTSLIESVLSNQRYVCETLLGITGGQTGDYAQRIILNNGATNGGAIYFNKGTATYLKANAAGTEIAVHPYSIKIPSPFVVKGDRASIIARYRGTTSSGFYIGGSSSAYGFYKANGEGSIIGVGAMFYNVANATRSIDLQCRINGVEVSQTLTTQNFTGGGDQTLTAYATAARGVDTFVADDLIDFYVDPSSSASEVSVVAFAEIVLENGAPGA